MKTKVLVLFITLSSLSVSINAQANLANIRMDFLAMLSIDNSPFVIEKSKDLKGISYMDLSVYKLNQPLNSNTLKNPLILNELISNFKGNLNEVSNETFKDLGQMNNYHIYYQEASNTIIATDSNNSEIILQGKLK